MSSTNSAVVSGRGSLATSGFELETPVATAQRASIIWESHERSRAGGLRPEAGCDFTAQGLADFKITQERNARLHAQALPVMEMLLEQVSHTDSLVVLTDGSGTILRTFCNGTFMEHAERVALRSGVSWAESSKGTNAVGTALMLEADILIHANEHYVRSNQFLTCSAAPIFDHSGNVIGVLDVSGDHRSYHPHTMGLVKMSARTIENHWFRDNFRQSLCLHFHERPERIGTIAEGIVALDADGRVLGVNRAGLQLLGASCAALRLQGLRVWFGLSFDEMMDRLRASRCAPLTMRLADGRTLYAEANFGAGMLLKSVMGQRRSGLSDEHDVAGEAVVSDETARREPMDAEACGKPSSERSLDELGPHDPHMRAVVEKLKRVIDRGVPILVLGETGTGKELLAGAIHRHSARARKPFVAVNCAAIPEALIESELFGYEEGAFTGARRKGATGRLLQANGGTLFLDEIGDMPLSLQTRLLRVLQERRITPLGSGKAIDIDVILVCATHRNLRDMIAAHTFREDLYYRINGLSVRLPRLGERADLRQLCHAILQEEASGRALRINPRLMEALHRYAWPGNLRQLRNVLRTAAIMAGTESEITSQHLSEDFLDELQWSAEPEVVAPPAGVAASAAPVGAQAAPPVVNDMHQVELDAIRAAIAACGGNVSCAAAQLNISRNTIYRKLKAADRS